jgi:hypothetical protein
MLALLQELIPKSSYKNIEMSILKRMQRLDNIILPCRWACNYTMSNLVQITGFT